MGGNGEKVQHTSLVAGFAAGNGGGCVKTGPFKKYDPPPPFLRFPNLPPSSLSVLTGT
jgi:hypothetical protein